VLTTYCKFTLVKINTKRNTFPVPPYHVFKLNVYFMILSQLTQQLVYEMHVRKLFVCSCVNAGQLWEEACNQRASESKGIDIKRRT
jgi:hypothetical protein